MISTNAEKLIVCAVMIPIIAEATWLLCVIIVITVCQHSTVVINIGLLTIQPLIKFAHSFQSVR